VLNLNFIHSTQRYTFTPFVRYLDICIGTYLVYDDEVTDHNNFEHHPEAHCTCLYEKALRSHDDKYPQQQGFRNK
jgi:hypothetical protein